MCLFLEMFLRKQKSANLIDMLLNQMIFVTNLVENTR